MAKDTIDDVIDYNETPDVSMMNDAEVHGTMTPAMKKLLDTEVTLMGGRLYGMKDRRNTQDGGWQAVKMSWFDWMNGMEGKFGLTRHPIAKSKEGDSLVFAAAMEGARKDSAITTMASIGLDIDSGAALDDVIEKLIELEMFAIVYTSFSHGKDVMELKHDDVMRKLKLDASPNRTQVQEYLRHHHKDRYDPEFIDSIEVLDPRKQTVDGLRIVLKTRPLDKFRVILPLAEPVELSDLAPTLSQWKDVWADAVCGVAVNMLGVNFDATSCDVNRLFFTPRHPKDAADWYACVIQGDPLGFEEIEPYSKNSYVKNRDDNDPFAAGTEDKGDEVVVYMSPSGKHLNKWHNAHKERFLLADVIEAFCEDKIRVSGGEKVGTVHCECPFEHEHTSSGGTATMVMNPLENELGFWTMFCRHDACNGRNKLEFMQEMLEQGWFEESLLEDDEWNLPSEDEQENDDDSVIEDESNDGFELDAAIAEAGLSKVSTTIAVKKFLRGYMDHDKAVKQLLIEKLGTTARSKGVTVLTPSDIKGLFKELADDAAKREIDKEVSAREKLKMPDYISLEEATKKTVEDAAKASKWLPSGYVYRDGWFGEVKPDGEGGTVFLPVCIAFEVVYSADGRKGSTHTNQILIRYPHRSKHLGIAESSFRIGDTYKDSGSILGKLANEGLGFHPKAMTENKLTILRAISSDRQAVYHEKSGWNKERTLYVSPAGHVVGADKNTIHVLDETKRVDSAVNGSVEMFYEAASAVLKGKNGQLFLSGFLISAVGCLVDFVGAELSVVVANEGKAKHGKSTALKAGIAWFAVPNEKGLLVTGDITETAAEALAVKANGAAFAPDEEGSSKLTAEETQRMALQYAGGIGRARGTVDAGVKDFNSWTGCMGLSTEHALLNRLEAANRKDGTDIKSGALSRIWPVSYDNAITLDAVADVDELRAYNVLAHNAKKGGGVYGVAGPVFAQKLLELGVDAVNARLDLLVKEWAGKHNGAASRVVYTGALFGVAAQIGQEAGLLPTDVDLRAMVKGLLEETLEARAHHLDTARQGKELLRMSIIRAAGNGLIRPTGDTDQTYRDILGYYKDGDGNFGTSEELTARTYILPLDRLSQLGVKGDHKALITDLRGARALMESNSSRNGVWRDTPGEGRVDNIRLSGEWVHGDKVEDSEKEV